jgi:hypothetical protein
MAPTTAQQEQEMERQVKALERQYLAGLVRVGLAGSLTPQALLFGTLRTLVPSLRSDEERNAAREMEEIRTAMLRWRETWRPWAVAGQRDNGTAYSVELWSSFGRELGERIQRVTGEAWDASVFAASARVAADTTQTVKTVVRQVEGLGQVLADALPSAPELKRWGRVAKVGAAVGGTVLVLGAVGYAVRAFR